VDIAKLFLEVAIGDEKRRLANDATAHGQLMQWHQNYHRKIKPAAPLDFVNRQSKSH
jgi:hypothetical protein